MLSLMLSWQAKVSATLSRSGSAKIMSTLFLKTFVILTIHSLVCFTYVHIVISFIFLTDAIVYLKSVETDELWLTTSGTSNPLSQATSADDIT